ncbi:ROK family transcriptional regulator [Niveibacterium sp. SC-1]|uniref:ROK family transcriptional regulator n=1 Tax=Niveibacterium sp. SC-1 TaxID=3135646 RepID=UPI00311DB4E3
MVRWDDLSPAELTVLETIFWSAGVSRAELAQLTDFSRSKANAAVAALIERGMLDETGPQVSSGGRRPETLLLSRNLGVLAAIDLGATSLDVALMTPDLTVLAHHSEPADVGSGPGVILSRVREVLRELRARCNIRREEIFAIGMGAPGPVEFGSALLVAPPIMPGWEGFSIREYLREEYAAPAYIDNDVNVMAMGELWRTHRQVPNFIVVKIGTGIGCGIVCNGMIYRGADGSAGDVGHICVDPNGQRCHCGNQGCVEVMAAGPAIARMGTEAAQAGQSQMLADVLADKGVITPEEVGQASRSGDNAANAIIKLAGTLIGQMLASAVNFFNPSQVFICGGISRIGPLFLAAIRQSVYHRSLALSTRHLEIQYAPLGERAGIIGAGALALHETLRNRGRLP